MKKAKKENSEKPVRNCNVEDEDKNIQEIIHKQLMKITKTVNEYDVLIKITVANLLGSSSNMWLILRCHLCGCPYMVVIPRWMDDYRVSHQIEGWGSPCACLDMEGGMA